MNVIRTEGVSARGGIGRTEREPSLAIPRRRDGDMASTSSMIALLISVAALALVVWAMAETERSGSLYGHSLPDSYSAPAARG